MSLALYPHYKSTGAQWPSELPRHWELKRLKQTLRLVTEKALGSDNPIALENVESWSGNLLETERTFEADGIAFEPGDILFGKLRPYLAKAHLAKVAGQAVGDFHVLRPAMGINGRFAQYQMLTREFIAIADSSTYGAKMPRVSWDFLANMVVPSPPDTEQRAIAAFLDQETTKLDALVVEQRRLVGLLEEKRRAVIAHVVTKGLNPDAPKTRSGLEWLGMVPKHWKLVRLGTLFRESAEPGNDGLPVLSVSIHHGVSDKEFEDEEMDRKVTRSDDRSKYIRVQPGDLVYNMMRAWQGGFGTVKVQGMVSPAYVVARPKVSICTEFVEQLLRTPQAIEELRRHSHGVTDFRLRLYWDEFKSIKISIPPIEEQRSILTSMDSEVAKIDALVDECESAIGLLQERRAALISAAVTGKIDVRGVVATQLQRETAA